MFIGLISLIHTWSWALVEKLPIVQLVKNFPAFYGTRKFITVFTRTLHWSLSWARSIQSILLWVSYIFTIFAFHFYYFCAYSIWWWPFYGRNIQMRLWIKDIKGFMYVCVTIILKPWKIKHKQDAVTWTKEYSQQWNTSLHQGKCKRHESLLPIRSGLQPSRIHSVARKINI
jgi:hypothetical protein